MKTHLLVFSCCVWIQQALSQDYLCLVVYLMVRLWVSAIFCKTLSLVCWAWAVVSRTCGHRSVEHIISGQQNITRLSLIIAQHNLSSPILSIKSAESIWTLLCCSLHECITYTVLCYSHIILSTTSFIFFIIYFMRAPLPGLEYSTGNCYIFRSHLTTAFFFLLFCLIFDFVFPCSSFFLSPCWLNMMTFYAWVFFGFISVGEKCWLGVPLYSWLLKIMWCLEVSSIQQIQWLLTREHHLISSFLSYENLWSNQQIYYTQWDTHPSPLYVTSSTLLWDGLCW